MSRFTIDELVQRMAKLSLQDNSVDKTSTDAWAVTIPQKARRSSKITKSGRKRTIPLHVILDLSRNFVQLDATRVFAQIWEATFNAWMALLSMTQIAPCGPLTVKGLAAAVRALDGVISGKNEPYLPPRFGYVQLFGFLESLRKRIERDKKHGFIEAESHRTNAALAYELYRNAQDIPTTASHLRRLRLIGSRWKDAVRSSPFLLLAFSKTAESFAKSPSKADNQTFQKLVLKALDYVPDKLKYVCGELSSIADREAASRLSSDPITRAGLKDCVKECLFGPEGG
ncbi:hypothetical protein BBAD15_g11874 [Beauveria bassiana D1-5]|uniref:Uncharacterized protein n=1 Tax=Beauveria bassiana D1-5 TaxID=1245745 RepID=A0A0A2V989_BEABA|nr:hypothetical protein BBAD15_g11874 [Beauveria bassiana D1-5]